MADAVWIPLRASEQIEREGLNGHEGFRAEFFGLGSVAIPMDHREHAEKLGWSDIGLIHSQDVWSTDNYYKPVDVYQYTDKVSLGTELVLVQNFHSEPSEWHLHHDLVFALKLLREGDQWIKPDEGYNAVARLRRNKEGKIISLEIKNEYLRDYLCARGMILRIASFRSRDVVVKDVAEVGSPAPLIEVR